MYEGPSFLRVLCPPLHLNSNLLAGSIPQLYTISQMIYDLIDVAHNLFMDTFHHPLPLIVLFAALANRRAFATLLSRFKLDLDVPEYPVSRFL